MRRPQPLDRNGADDGRDERGADGRDAQEVARRDVCESDLPDPFADQAHPALDEDEADRGREQTDDRARRERVSA